MGLLNSPLLFFIIGVLLGLYLGNSKIRKSANDYIDKHLFKKKLTDKTKPGDNLPDD